MSVSIFILNVFFIQGLYVHSKRHHSYSSYGYHLDRKLHSISHWLDSRPDSTIYDYIYHVNAGAGLNLFEGDIKGYHLRSHHYRNAIRSRNALWHTRRVPYEFHPSFDVAGRQDVLDAIADFHNKTCITFVPRTHEKDYVLFRQLEGCFSHIGRQGGPQNVSLAPDCLKKGTAIHEIMHVLGFFHEQSRPDRDYWIRVIFSNVEKGKKPNFEKLNTSVADTLGISYDYGSVMHYSKTAFSKNGYPTILPTRSTNVQIGQRKGFSDLDIEKINTLYRCDLLPPPLTTISSPTRNPLTLLSANLIGMTGWSQWSSWSKCDLRCERKRYRFCFNVDTSVCTGGSQEIKKCDQNCKPAFYIGCWKVDPQNLTISSAEGIFSTLNDQHSSRTYAMRKCADVAAANGFSVFALFNNGECLTDSNAHKTFSTLGASDGCGYNSKGGPEAISVYTFTTNIDGEWSQWKSWGQCTLGCGGGVQYRYRQCDNPPRIGNGTICNGSDIEQRPCNTDKCIENPKCGLKLYTGSVGESGIIELDDYENMMECNYEIQTRNNLTISLLITSIDIELSIGCVYDALTIFDGDPGSKVIGTHCGNIRPDGMISSTNKVSIHFKSDETMNGTGFTMYYSINDGKKKSCIQPIPTAHCTISPSSSSNYVGNSVTYTCNPGYKIKGTSSTVTCLDQPAFAVWSDFFPVCVRTFRRKRSNAEFPSLCDFEGHLCGYTQSIVDDFDWSVEKPVYSQQIQKPSVDYKNSSKGHFLYAESSRFQSLGDTAEISSKIFNSTGNKCLCFWYRTFHVYEKDTSTVEVFVQDTYDFNIPPVWTSNINRDNHWRFAKIYIFPTSSFQIVLRYTVGDVYGSSFAIDDIFIVDGPCSDD